MENFIKLNGQTTGFAVYLHEKEDFIKEKQTGLKKLFKNLNDARSWLANVYKIYNATDYKLWIITPEIEIDFDDVQQVDGYYQYFYNTRLIFIEEERVDKVNSLGYIVFEDGDKKKNDKNGSRKNKEFVSMVTNVVNDIVKEEADLLNGIESITETKNGHIMLNIKNCTGKVCICTIAQLMDFNMSRKELELRGFPFLADKDKFFCLYIYSIKSMSEPNGFETEKKTKAMIDLIMEYLQVKYFYVDPHYVPVEFKGTIRIDGGIL